MTDEEQAFADAEAVNRRIVEATQGLDPKQRELFFRVVIGSLMGMIDRVNPQAAEMAFPGIAKTARLCVLMSEKKTGRRVI